MTEKETRQTGFTSLRQQAEKLLSLPPDDFRKLPTQDVRNLMSDLLLVVRELERQVEQLQQTQRELEESRKKVAEFFDLAPVGYFILDGQGVTTDVNFTAIHLLSASRDSLVNSPFVNFVAPQYHDAFGSYLKEIALSGSVLSTELEVRKGDGSLFWAQLQTVTLYENSKRIYRMALVDVTVRKQAEEARKESEQKFQDLADLFPEVVFETDTTGKVTYANKKVLTSFHLDAGDLTKGLNIFELIVPEQRSTAAERFRRILGEGDLGAHEYTLLIRDGSTFPALVHSARIMHGSQVSGVRGVAINITEQKMTEQTLKESERRLRTTLDNMLEGCVIVDFAWRYRYVNDAAVRLGRRTKEERVGRTMMEVFPGIEKQATFAYLKRCMENRVPEQYETEYTFPEGNKAWFEVRVEPVPEGILILYFDINERKMTEQRLKKGI